MSRKVQFVGRSLNNDYSAIGGFQLSSYAQRYPSFPDVDPVWVSATVKQPNPARVRPSVIAAADGRAFCLAPNTDWDALDVTVDSDSLPIRLTPGVLVRRPFTSLTIRPPAEMLPMATRLYAGRNFQDISPRPLAVLPANVALVVSNSNANIQVKATAGATISFKVWNGAAWVAGPGGLTGLGDTATVCALNEDSVGPTHYRPADISPDGVISLADMMQTGGLDGGLVNPGTRRGANVFRNRHYDMSDASGALTDGKPSQFAFDYNGNPGDATDPSIGTYQSPWIPASGTPQSTLAEYFYGRCGLEIFDGEDAPCDYRPRLDAERRIQFEGFFSINQVAVAGIPDVPIVTVPAFNVDSALFQGVVDATSSEPVRAAIKQGTAYESPDAPLSVFASPISDATAAGSGVSVQVTQNGASWLQLVLGAEAGPGGVVSAGAELILRRRFIGG